MATVRKSVRLILQNSTFELLTIEGFDVIQGQWNAAMAPKIGGVVAMQSSASWMTESLEGGVGTSGFLRLGSTKGYLVFRWDLPWCRTLGFEIEYPDSLIVRRDVNEELPDFPIIMATLDTVREQPQKRAGRK